MINLKAKSPQLINLIEEFYKFLMYFSKNSRNKKAYNAIKQKAFGEDSEIPEEELKAFNDEFGKYKDFIVNYFTPTKAEVGSLIVNKIEEEEEIPEEICDEEEESPSEKTEITTFITPKSFVKSPTEHTTYLHLGVPPEQILNLKKKQQLEQLRKHTLNTSHYKSKKIDTPEAKPPLYKMKEDIQDDSLDYSHDEAPPSEDKKDEIPNEETVDAKTQSIINALDSGLIQVNSIIISPQEDHKEKGKVNMQQTEGSLARDENADSLFKKNNGYKSIDEFEKNISVDTTRIEIIKFLGGGSEGKVYLGKIVSLNELVAIKQCEVKLDHSDFKRLIEMLAKEVELVKALTHPNVIKYYKLHRSNLRNLENVVEYNVIMEYMQKGSLADLLKFNKRGLPKAQIQEIVKQVLKGLQYLHAHNIIHRDLKPANILIGNEGLYKITDFGISTQVKEKMTTIKRTCAGTPWYMAPEVILDKPYSYAADIWSLGCLTFELFCGKRPYASFGGMQAMFQMIQKISPIESCTPHTKYLFNLPENTTLLDFLNQCWRSNPIERPKAGKLLNHPFVRKKSKKKKGKKGKKGKGKKKAPKTIKN